MPGADPTDRQTFADAAIPKLRAAVHELSVLLGYGYAEGAASTLVGDHHQLDKRQRLAVRRCACADERAVARRRSRRTVDGHPLAIDGFNQLVTVERGLAGGAVLRGRDGALRDVASVHGTWRRGETTARAIERLGAALGDTDAVWVLDAPVSNSGRLAEVLRERWPVELADNADRRLLELAAQQGRWLATSDSALLDRCAGWVGLCDAGLVDGWIVDLG